MYKTTTPVITQSQDQQAQILSSKLKDSKQRKRAYVDFTGAFYLVDYMQNMGIRTNIQRSAFRCPKLYSDFEFTDIYCNSHMVFVITTYGTEIVKIPVSHKEFGILPEGYVVVDLKIGMKEAEIKGVVLPSDLDGAEVEGKYYKFSFKDLKGCEEFFKGLKKYSGIKPSVGRHLDCMALFVPYLDNLLNEADKKKLIGHILTCETCKKRLIDTIDFDTKARAIENHEGILSKEDINSKEAFLKRLQAASSGNSTKLKGAIDVIYKGEEFSKLKEETLKYRADIPPKAKKLILLAFSVIGILLVLIIFAFNIPKPSPDRLNNSPLQEETFVENVEYENQTTPDYEVKIPAIKKGNLAAVSKVSWEVSSSTKDEQKKFLQQAGKSIRLNLQNDLLLSNEAIMHSRVKFDIRFLRDGSLDEVAVNESSGTNAVDNIIKQSIENTLYYMRPPKGSFVGKKNGLTLVIDFKG